MNKLNFYGFFAKSIKKASVERKAFSIIVKRDNVNKQTIVYGSSPRLKPGMMLLESNRKEVSAAAVNVSSLKITEWQILEKFYYKILW